MLGFARSDEEPRTLPKVVQTVGDRIQEVIKEGEKRIDELITKNEEKVKETITSIHTKPKTEQEGFKPSETPVTEIEQQVSKYLDEIKQRVMNKMRELKEDAGGKWEDIKSGLAQKVEQVLERAPEEAKNLFPEKIQPREEKSLRKIPSEALAPESGQKLESEYEEELPEKPLPESKPSLKRVPSEALAPESGDKLEYKYFSDSGVAGEAQSSELQPAEDIFKKEEVYELGQGDSGPKEAQIASEKISPDSSVLKTDVESESRQEGNILPVPTEGELTLKGEPPQPLKVHEKSGFPKLEFQYLESKCPPAPIQSDIKPIPFQHGKITQDESSQGKKPPAPLSAKYSSISIKNETIETTKLSSTDESGFRYHAKGIGQKINIYEGAQLELLRAQPITGVLYGEPKTTHDKVESTKPSSHKPLSITDIQTGGQKEKGQSSIENPQQAPSDQSTHFQPFLRQMEQHEIHDITKQAGILSGQKEKIAQGLPPMPVVQRLNPDIQEVKQSDSSEHNTLIGKGGVKVIIDESGHLKETLADIQRGLHLQNQTAESNVPEFSDVSSRLTSEKHPEIKEKKIPGEGFEPVTSGESIHTRQPYVIQDVLLDTQSRPPEFKKGEGDKQKEKEEDEKRKPEEKFVSRTPIPPHTEQIILPTADTTEMKQEKEQKMEENESSYNKEDTQATQAEMHKGSFTATEREQSNLPDASLSQGNKLAEGAENKAEEPKGYPLKKDEQVPSEEPLMIKKKHEKASKDGDEGAKQSEELSSLKGESLYEKPESFEGEPEKAQGDLKSGKEESTSTSEERQSNLSYQSMSEEKESLQTEQLTDIGKRSGNIENLQKKPSEKSGKCGQCDVDVDIYSEGSSIKGGIPDPELGELEEYIIYPEYKETQPNILSEGDNPPQGGITTEAAEKELQSYADIVKREA